MATCGFGAVVVNDVFEAKYPFGTDLEGRFLYVCDGLQQWLLAAFDFAEMWRSTCLAWRRQVSQATGIPAANIWVHLLQTHAAPSPPLLDGEPCEKLTALCIPVIKQMIAEAEEANLGYVIADLEGRFNFNREVYVPELGAVTSWGGQLQTADEGPPYTQDPDVLLLCGYKPDLPAFDKPIYFDRPADPLAALLVFRNTSGNVLGTLSRFTGHPDIGRSCIGLGSRMEQYHYHFDWPGYVRRKLDEELGGTGVCVNGPCGNVGMKYTAPLTYEGSDAIAREIGEGIALACLEAWRQESPKQEPLRLGAVKAIDIDLPLHESMPHSRAKTPSDEELQARLEPMRADFERAVERGDPPARIKRMADEIQFTERIIKMVKDWANLTDDELRGRVMTVELQAARLNDLVLNGLPGESMTETAMLLRAQTIGKRLITLDQINGYHAYIANDNAHDEGGFSHWCCMLARGAEPLLRRAAMQLVSSVCV